MSLQLAAQHLSHQGRGGDSTLVHMSPREVKSLNDLAMAHGGQLSINPQTGLPEAGFLSSILPMVAGAALTGLSGGAINPMTAGLITGGLGYAMTGSLSKGLMMGLGAYGGANLGAGLAETAVTMDPNVVTAQNAVVENAVANQYNPANTSLTPDAWSSSLPENYASTQQAAKNTLAESLKTARDTAAGPDTFMGNLQQMGKGIGSLGKEGGFSSLYQNLGGSPMSLISKLGPAAAPAIGEAMTPKKLEEEKADKDMGQRYGFSMNPAGGQSPTGAQSRSLGGGQQQVQPGQDPLANTQSPTTTPFPTPNIQGKEERYFAPSYTKLTPEQAKLIYGYADGGTAQANPEPATEPFPMPQYTNAGKQPSGETPALQAFKLMQAQRAVQPQTPQYASTPATGGAPAANAPVPTTVEGLYRTYLDRTPEQQGLEHWNKHFGSSVDADEAALFRRSAAPELAANKRQAEQTGGSLAHEYEQYLRQTVGSPNQLQAPTAPPPTTTNLADSGFAFDPITQRYSEIKGTAASTEPAADAFNVENRPVVGYTATGEKIYGEKKKGPYGTAQWTHGQGAFAASGGLMAAYAGGGMTEADRMAAASSYIGGNTSYPQARSRANQFSTPAQIPTGKDVISKGSARIDLSTGEERLAGGGISHLGDYSDGGRLLRGPGDGVSDSIPAMIGRKQPARLADGEFVVPARIVSELGNGSTEAGARKLYAMMDRIQKARGKTVGKGKVAKNSRSEKYLPA
jgi:hypothetical protein